MQKLNFGSIKTVQATSTSTPRLKPWNIYEVTFSGCRVEHIKGKKDPEATYDILKVRFDGDEGYYEESIFFPKDEDAERPIYKNKEGHDYEAPSNFERTMTFIAQVAKVINPEGFTKMQELSGKFKSFDDVCTVLIKITDPMKGKFKTNLKLIGKTDKDGNINAALPKFCAINKDKELFTSDNFIGDKLGFSPYEEGKRKEFLSAKPTNMEKVTTSSASEDTNDLDSFDVSDLDKIDSDLDNIEL